MHLTPEILEQAYALLIETPPFKSWKLPHPDEVEFTVSSNRGVAGQFWVNEKGDMCIAGSAVFIGRIDSLICFVAHELVHMRLYLIKDKSWALHGRAFRKLAREVCKAHGFDLKLFV